MNSPPAKYYAFELPEPAKWGEVTRISRTETVALLPPVRLTRRERAANLAVTILALAFMAFLVISTIVGGVTIVGKISSRW